MIIVGTSMLIAQFVLEILILPNILRAAAMESWLQLLSDRDEVEIELTVFVCSEGKSVWAELRSVPLSSELYLAIS